MDEMDKVVILNEGSFDHPYLHELVDIEEKPDELLKQWEDYWESLDMLFPE